MSTKRRRIPGVITSLLVVGLVLVLLSCAKDENEKLIKASKEGRLEEVTRLLNSGADVNAKDKDRRHGTYGCFLLGPPRCGEASPGKRSRCQRKKQGRRYGTYDRDRSRLAGGRKTASREGRRRQCKGRRIGGYGTHVRLPDREGTWIGSGDMASCEFWTEALMSMRDKRRAGQLCGTPARKGYSDMVKLLLDKGADVKAKVRTARPPCGGLQRMATRRS